jgi:hypothetical protein
MSDRIPNAPTSGSDAASLTDSQHVSDTEPEPSLRKTETGVYPIAIEIALAAASLP